MNLENEEEFIINKDVSNDKKDSNFSSEKILYDEIKRAEKNICENDL